MTSLPFLSVVIPCRNEAAHITPCLESLLADDYPRDRLEILVVDGMSTDGTRERVQTIADRDPVVRRLDNPDHVTPAAMNRGVVASRGEVVLLAGAHNRYEPGFLRRTVEYLVRFPEADAVGGVIIATPRTAGRMGRAVARTISHPFGVGGSRFRTMPSTTVWADTAFGCCYRRSVFERIGLFNEGLIRGQDMEFNLRLRRRGGRLLLAPDLRSQYYARSTIREFWTHNFLNGVWAVLPFLSTPLRPVGVRHLVPAVFVTSLLCTAVAAPVLAPARWFLAILAGAYLVALLVMSAHAAWTARDPLLAPFLLVTFVNLHLGYGLGSVVGGLRVVGRWLRGERRPRGPAVWPRLPVTKHGWQ